MSNTFKVGDRIYVESHSTNGTIFLEIMGVEPNKQYTVVDLVTHTEEGVDYFGVSIAVDGGVVPVSDDDVVLA